MKRILPAALAALMLLALAACGSREPVPETYCDSLAQAEKLIGFSLEAPEALGGSGTETFCARGRTLEIMYFSGKVLNGRISKSDNGENIGGFDYGYTVRTQHSEGGTDYTFSGSGEGGSVYLATWTQGKYSYLVLTGEGKTPADMAALCQTVR